MSRTLAGFVILLTAIAIPPGHLHAQEPGKPESTKSGSGTLVLTGSDTYLGSTTVSGGKPELTKSASGTLVLSGSAPIGAARRLAAASWKCTMPLGAWMRGTGARSASPTAASPVPTSPCRRGLRRRRFPQARSFISSRKERGWATACGPCPAPARKRC